MPGMSRCAAAFLIFLIAAKVLAACANELILSDR